MPQSKIAGEVEATLSEPAELRWGDHRASSRGEEFWGRLELAVDEVKDPQGLVDLRDGRTFQAGRHGERSRRVGHRLVALPATGTTARLVEGDVGDFARQAIRRRAGRWSWLIHNG